MVWQLDLLSTTRRSVYGWKYGIQVPSLDVCFHRKYAFFVIWIYYYVMLWAERAKWISGSYTDRHSCVQMWIKHTKKHNAETILMEMSSMHSILFIIIISWHCRLQCMILINHFFRESMNKLRENVWIRSFNQQWKRFVITRKLQQWRKIKRIHDKK